MSSRITKKFAELKKKNKKALITYITLGDPSLDKTIELVLKLEKAGADMIELGIPYSDPLADGPIIQRSCQRALRQGVNIKTVFETTLRLRQKTNIPLIFLTYYNAIFSYGIKRFLQQCRNCGVDGLIIPDLPLEERELLNKIAQDYCIDLIPIVAPTSNKRIEKIVGLGGGFVYCISSKGVTGSANKFDDRLDSFIREVKKYSKLPLAIGFGIKSSEDIRRLKPLADGLIVGSAIVKGIEMGIENRDINERIYKITMDLNEAMD